jgi:hypothetical protein
VSGRRWAGATVAMCAVAWALRSLSPGLPELRGALADPQGLVDRAGADALLLTAVPVLAWLCWAWGAVGLVLTAASTVPGWTGQLAGLLLGGVLPAGARRAAAVALGIGLSTAAPVVLLPTASPSAVSTALADETAGSGGGVLVDWPGALPADVVPDWPGAPASPTAPPDRPQDDRAEHVVVRGDCLWDIAADWSSRQRGGAPVSDADVHRATQAWWQANATVIGPDPDLLLPGQVLRPPG